MRIGLHTAPMTFFSRLPFLLLLPLAFTARAESPRLPALEKISRTATIGMSHRESSVPFSYNDGSKRSFNPVFSQRA